MTSVEGQRCLMILGMHRSYTSMVAGWLSKCGLEIGQDLLGSGVGNKLGHFEDRKFLHIHEKILVDNGLAHTGLHEDGAQFFDEAGYANLMVSQERKWQLRQILNLKPKQFGWKDPRTCLFLDCYRELIPKAHSLILLRHYNDVVVSLLRRDRDMFKKLPYRERWHLWRKGYFQSKNAYLGAWIFYNKALMRHAVITNCPIILNPLEGADNLMDQLSSWGYKLDRLPLQNVVESPLVGKRSDKALIYDSGLEDEAKFVLALFANFSNRIG